MEKCPLLLIHSATFDKSAAEKLEPVKTVPSVFGLSLGDGDLMLPVKTRGKKKNQHNNTTLLDFAANSTRLQLLLF